MSVPVIRPQAYLAGVAIHTLFRGDRSQLLQWCNFHLNAGAERLFVVLDRPPRGFLQSLPSHPRVDWHVADQQTWDALYPAGGSIFERKTSARPANHRKLHDSFRWTAHRAVAQGYDFLAFIDADELLSLTEPFRDLVRRFPDASAITVPVREMWFAEGEVPGGPFSATLGLRKSSARAINWNDAVGWRAQYLRNGLLGHYSGKSIYRLPLVSGEIGSHRPQTGALAQSAMTLPIESGALLHFDSGSLAIWNEKWGLRLQGETLAIRLGPQRQAQEQLFAHTLRLPPEKQSEFFREFYSLNADTQSLLEEKGILQRVDVGEELTAPFEVDAKSARPRKLRRLPPIANRADFQFGLVCDRSVVKPTLATMSSVLLHMGDLGSVRFIVLGDGLSEEDVTVLKSLEHTRYDVKVAVHDISAVLDRDVGDADQRRAAFGRAYLVDYLPEQRTVCLEADVLATRPFPELFQWDLGSAALAGVTDSAALRLRAEPADVPVQQRIHLIGITGGYPLEYLDAGVLIFDVDKPDFRDLAMQARSLVVLHAHTLQHGDQDALNLAFARRKHLLPSAYNYMTQSDVSGRIADSDLIQSEPENLDVALVHFSGSPRPWLGKSDTHNSLYRRLVSATEEKLGINCGFDFSRRVTSRATGWTIGRWAEVLGATAEHPATPELPAPEDITLVDICDERVYLTLSPSMYELASSSRLRLAAFSQGRTLFEVPLAGVSAQQLHLSARVASAVRVLPVNLHEALAVCGGVARNVEFALMGPDQSVGGRFVRSLSVLDLLAAGPEATPGLLVDLGVDGRLESLSDGWLRGWLRPRSQDGEDAVSLFMDGELVARRILSPSKEGSRTPLGTRPFKFFPANLVRLGYGQGGEIAVRLSGTNVPLRGGLLSITDIERNMRYDAARDRWVEMPDAHLRAKPPSVRRRIRRRTDR